MKTLNREDHKRATAEWDQLIDHRAAIINQMIFDLTSYDNRHIVSIWDATDCSNLSDINPYQAADFMIAYQFSDARRATEFFCQKIRERALELSRHS